MKQIFINLKRFDIPKRFGGICPEDNPVVWIEGVMQKSIELGLHTSDQVSVVYFLPEALIATALGTTPSSSKSLAIGCQGVHYEDTAKGGNFGAFTTARPAAAMAALGCQWVMVGHSEERRSLLHLMGTDQKDRVDELLSLEIARASERNMNVLFCVGETEEEKGSNDFAIYESRVKAVIKNQLLSGFSKVDVTENDPKFAIAYEPVWAIGPGKTPPGAEYIEFVGSYIEEVCQAEFGKKLPIVYGGGLKEENAQEIASVKSISGGLVALTNFTDPIGFTVEGLKKIIDRYIAR